jgi:hypothetical protein
MKEKIVSYINQKLIEMGKDWNPFFIIKYVYFLSYYSLTLDKGDGLFEYFNNFNAQPHGTIESDVVKILSKSEFSDGNLDDDIKVLVDESFDILEDKGILDMDAFELIELNRLHPSWKYYYKLAGEDRSKKIPIQSLLLEKKYLFKY